MNEKKWELLKPFLNDPELEVSSRELSRLSGVSVGWVSEIVNELEQKNILTVEKAKAVNKISKGEKFKDLKEIYNLNKIKESGIVEFLDSELRPDGLILFGSYERGEDLKDSDIDIAVLNGRKQEIDLRKYEEDLGREIELQHIKDLENTDKNFKNSLANGKVIYGFIEVG